MSPKEIASRLSYEDTHELNRDLNARFKWETQFFAEGEKESLLALQVNRLEKLLGAMWPSAMMGDIGSGRAALEIVKEISKHTQVITPDAATGQQTVLVIGGQEADYVNKLREIVDGD